MKEILNPSLSLAPVPITLISYGDFENSNITSIAWTGILCSDPMTVYVSIRPTRYSYEIISKTNEFVINLPDEKQIKEISICGTKSGRDVDKFKECNFTKGNTSKISTAYIKECKISLECKVKEIKKIGAHDMFIAEVVSVIADDDMLDENKNIVFEKANLIGYYGGKYFGMKQLNY